MSLLDNVFQGTENCAIFTTDLNHLVTSWSLGAEKVLGFRAEEMLGKNADVALLPPRSKGGRRPLLLPPIRSDEGFYRYIRKDGSRLWMDGVSTPIVDDGGRALGYLRVLRDATERKREREKVRRMAAFDALTGVLNRASFDMHMEEIAALAARSGEMFLLLMIDLDRFKEVNDTFGHYLGDELLRQAAARIVDVSRRSDVIARLGGDEFAVIQRASTSFMNGGEHATKICEALARPFQIDDKVIRSGASIGVAVFPRDASSAQGLLRNADLALYKAKGLGRSRFQYFTAEMDREAHARNRDKDELRRVLENKLFWLEYQPMIDHVSGRAVAVEALVRFPGPVLSHRPVEEIIALARESALIVELGEAVFREACCQLRRWQALGLNGLKVCVNTCAKELVDARYIAAIDASLERCAISASSLEIELTEREAIEIEKLGDGVFNSLKSRGFSLALDDFGTGYSSLGYLRTLPVDTIKLDKSFLKGVPENSDATAIIEAMARLAKNLHLRVVAEGVEEASQAGFLVRIGCDVLQGFLIARAMPEAEATQWLQSNWAHPSPVPAVA